VYPNTYQLPLERVSPSTDTIFREPSLAVFYATREMFISIEMTVRYKIALKLIFKTK